jgi:hypothetical protein
LSSARGTSGLPQKHKNGLSGIQLVGNSRGKPQKFKNRFVCVFCVFVAKN